MSTLADLQRRFALDVAVATAEGDARLAIYRNTICANYRSALRATYPVVCALTGTPFFNAAVDAFVRAHPSQGGDLNVYGGAFGAFLAGYSHARELPYLPDVARLEWAIDEVHRAAEVAAAPQDMVATLAAVPAERLAQLRFVIDPSCRLLYSIHPVLRIWQVHQEDFAGKPDVDFASPPDCLLLRRDTGPVVVERIAPGEYAWLQGLADGATLAAALDAALEADAAFSFESALHTRIADRTLAGLRLH